MSHFTSIKTQIIEKEYLKQALSDLGHTYQDGNIQIRGYQGNRTDVEIKVPTKNSAYDIGFRKSGNAYEIVADWWGIRDIKQDQFIQQVFHRYAYHAAKAKLEEQGFSLVSEEVQKEERIHLVLRRTV
jgi:predicted AlkP superfamily pyrophosphatase or phosphodiesterase